jgi:LysM repeat protein
MIRLKSLLFEGSGPIPDSYIDKGLNIARQLMSRGFTDKQAAAIVGNMWAESTFDPSAENSIGAVGLLQWLGTRKTALMDYAKKRKKKWSDFELQLDFIKYELIDAYDGTYDYEKNMFNKAMNVGKSIKDISAGFATYSERPNKSELTDSLPTRQIAAVNIFNALKNKKTTSNAVNKSALIGKTVYPLKKNGYVNVREESEVDSGLFDNLLTTINYPNPVGYIKRVVAGEKGETWYEVVLMNKETGYVRSDVVTTTNESQYEIKSGDTLTSIAKNRNTTVDNIMKKNPGLDATRLQIGQKIKI